MLLSDVVTAPTVYLLPLACPSLELAVHWMVASLLVFFSYSGSGAVIPVPYLSMPSEISYGHHHDHLNNTSMALAGSITHQVVP